MIIMNELKRLMDEHIKKIKHIHHKMTDCYFYIEYDCSTQDWSFNYFPYLSELTIELKDKDFNELINRAYSELAILLREIRRDLKKGVN